MIAENASQNVVPIDSLLTIWPFLCVDTAHSEICLSKSTNKYRSQVKWNANNAFRNDRAKRFARRPTTVRTHKNTTNSCVSIVVGAVRESGRRCCQTAEPKPFAHMSIPISAKQMHCAQRQCWCNRRTANEIMNSFDKTRKDETNRNQMTWNVKFGASAARKRKRSAINGCSIHSRLRSDSVNYFCFFFLYHCFIAVPLRSMIVIASLARRFRHLSWRKSN